MAIRNGSGLVVDERKDLSRGASDDVIASDVRRRGEKLTRIVNIYNQHNTQSGERERLTRKLNWKRVIPPGGTVLAGNFNAHSKRWDPRCQVHWNAAFWEGAIEKNGLEIGNEGRPTHFWTRENHEGELVIDLTLANRPIAKWTILADDHTTGSDHEVIEWKVGVDRQEEADCERVVGWNLVAMMQKDAEAAEKLWMELTKERAQLDAECTEDEVEQETAWFQQAVSRVLDHTEMKIRICARSKRWWNSNINGRRRTVGRVRRRRENSEEAARAKGELQKSIWQSSSKMGGDYLPNFRGAEVWRAARYVNPPAGMTMEALTYTDGK
jgi:hypothetical protein